jgi:hypothetical protein
VVHFVVTQAPFAVMLLVSSSVYYLQYTWFEDEDCHMNLKICGKRNIIVVFIDIRLREDVQVTF